MRIGTLAVMTASISGMAFGQEVAGDWQGTLSASGVELHLVLHLTKEGSGYKGTIDSIDQSANGIPIESVSYANSKLTLKLPVIHGSYEGTVSSSGDRISGTWTQGQPVALDFTRAKAQPKTEQKAAKPSDIDGAWLGALDTGGIKLRIVFHIVNTDEGLKATVDSPDQNARGLPAKIARDGASVQIELNQIAARFDGKLNSSLTTLDGEWSQGGRTFPLVLTRVKNSAALERARPQTPKRPFPYDQQDVSYENKAAGVRLNGTLTLPRGSGPFAAAILIPGSGPHDRDEFLFEHRPFLVLADYLTRRGLAVLRYDDRGVGKSSGDFASATTPDLASDVEAGLAFLGSRGDINPHKIGLIGHSEGGLIAPMVAERDASVAFLVLMAGPGARMDQVLSEQLRGILEASGRKEEEIQKAVQQRAAVFKAVEEKDNAALEKRLREEFPEAKEAELQAQLKAVMTPWFRFLLTYDPAPALRQLRCPVLAINGSKDLQVSAKQNLPAICAALSEGGNKNFQIDELDGLNHLFQTAVTGAPSEYGEIQETMSPVALETIASWIARQIA